MTARPADSATVAHVLVVDDDVTLLQMLEQTLKRAGHLVSTAPDAEQGLGLVKELVPQVVVTDVVLPAMDGIEFLKHVKAAFPGIEVVVMTAYATLERAVEAMRIGAYDFVEKPVDRDRLLRAVTKAVEKQVLLSENSRLRERLAEEEGTVRLVGTSRAIGQIRETINQVAQTDAPVLITGDSGTGKEVVGDLIHALSARRRGPLVKISCAAIPENLLESELYGYERGAFSGALTTKSGRFELANGGTLVLDEIGEMPGNMQAKLLRVLQDGCVQRLGSTKDIRVDTRVISATNIDIDRALREGRFREDLYHRLNVFEIHIPPLRERVEDIPVLLAHFLRRLSARRAVPLEGVTPEALAVLSRHTWPGNVRELENVVQRAVATAPGPVLTEADVRLATFVGRVPTPQARGADGILIPPGTRMEEAQRILFDDALQRCGGNKERAAQVLGISARTLTRWAKRGRVDEGAPGSRVDRVD